MRRRLIFLALLLIAPGCDRDYPGPTDHPDFQCARIQYDAGHPCP
jgi:hypothetical protein